MEESLKRLMSYARVGILLIISLILIVLGTTDLDPFGVLFIMGVAVAVITAVRFAVMAILDIVSDK